MGEVNKYLEIKVKDIFNENLLLKISPLGDYLKDKMTFNLFNRLRSIFFSKSKKLRKKIKKEKNIHSTSPPQLTSSPC